jgi:hypothetical protein
MLIMWIMWIAALTGAATGEETIPSLADAPEAERSAVDRFATSSAWAHRAMAALRLERYRDEDSRRLLEALLRDDVWQVRTFAIRTLRWRGDDVPSDLMNDEAHPRVVRTALRHHVPMDPDRVRRGVEHLARSMSADERLLAVEIATASQDDELMKTAEKALKSVINRMERAEAGMLSPRLARVTGSADLQRDYRWRTWLLKNTLRLNLQPVFAFDKDAAPTSVNGIAALSSEQFIGLRNYMTALDTRDLELVICLDCTASMGGELSQAQGDLDAMLLFLGDIVKSLRVGLVAYRDHNADFETKTQDLTTDFGAVRRALWTLSADEGGDTPEAVYPAMKRALYEFTWTRDADKVLVVVGDAPPHVGFGTACVRMAEAAARTANLTTHTVQAKGEPVKHFEEIAAAGGGTCLSLDEHDSLVVELAGLSVTEQFRDQFREFFRVYLEVCR